MRERIIENFMNIKFEENRYTTPITMEFRIKNQDHTVNPFYFYCEIFMEIRIINPTTKLISNKVTVFPKLGTMSTHLRRQIKPTRYKSLKVYANHQPESAIPFKKILYKNILVFYLH